MFSQSQIAFKEWASVVEVLGRGEQILILRKGGIHEKGLPAGRQGKKFNVAQPEFFLFPTFEHQNPRDLKPEGQALLKRVLAAKPEPDVLPLQYYCVVEESFWISEEGTLRELDSFHLWSWECVKGRYKWGEEKGLFGIVVRTYSFLKTLLLENLKRYGGCRSWVELEKSIPTAPLKPVLSEKAFEEKKREIDLLLGNSLTRL